MAQNFFSRVWQFLKRKAKLLIGVVLALIAVILISLLAGKLYQGWDDDPDRGAIAMTGGAFGEDYEKPVYLNQGWDENDSLWFYNTTQGSGLIPYDFFLVLEQTESQELFRSDKNMDRFRYLPQKATFFNEHALPVGFVKDEYQGRDYVGYTCAACHTAQINFKGTAIRIDGGPAMADMVSFLEELEAAMKAAQSGEKNSRFVEKVIELNNNYSSAEEVNEGLEKWTRSLSFYNTVNHSQVEYGYARLDAFGRIYNRVLEHMINKPQVAQAMALVMDGGSRLLSDAQIKKVLESVGETIIGDEDFAIIVGRLQSEAEGYPGLDLRQLMLVRNQIFNEPNAPVSYPFLWDIAQSDYVQWNGLADNAGPGPLGRNAGEVIGVFGILDWEAKEPGFSLSARLSGQKNKKKRVDFKSSIDLFNLERLETHLRMLTSPKWPEEILGSIDRGKAAEGKLIYAEYCQSCHEVIDPTDWDRLVIAEMSSLEAIGTDKAMATNSVNYKGKSGNFEHTYQKTDVGPVVIKIDAPVVQILTSATRGVIATPDPDKWFFRRWVEWVYTLVLSLANNDIEQSVKSGNYNPDTTAEPYRSLLSYKARSLNGIWATAPYLHNGSVPSLYDLLLPVKRPGDPADGEYRPTEFMVGSREFLPDRVGFRTEGYAGMLFKADKRGDRNQGHEYAAGKTAQPVGTTLPALSAEQRWNLIEYLKTL